MFNPVNLSFKKRIYDRIAYLGIVSKAELLRHFPTTTKSSLTRMLDEMAEQGLIAVSGLGSSTGGRKPVLFQTNPHYGYLLGLEITRLSFSVGLYDLHLKQLAHFRRKMDDTITPERLADTAATEIGRMLARHDISINNVLGIGIGAVGPLDQKRGIILEPDYFPSPAWKHVPICDLLTERLQIPAKLDNGANTALIGEYWAARSENVQHVLYVHAGVNIRSAVLSGGQLLRGGVDTEGAAGQMIIQTNGPRLSDKGNYGALEAFVSVPSLEDRVRTQLKIGRSGLLSGLPPERIQFDALVKALEQEDALVKEQFTETAAYLGIGLANLINALHPELIILGGPLVQAHSLVFETAVQIAQKNIYHYPQYSPIFTKGSLMDEAASAGAAVMMLLERELPELSSRVNSAPLFPN